MHKTAFNGLVQTAGISTPYMAPKSRGVPINDTPSVQKIIKLINNDPTIDIRMITPKKENECVRAPSAEKMAES